MVPQPFESQGATDVPGFPQQVDHLAEGADARPSAGCGSQYRKDDRSEPRRVGYAVHQQSGQRVAGVECRDHSVPEQLRHGQAICLQSAEEGIEVTRGRNQHGRLPGVDPVTHEARQVLYERRVGRVEGDGVLRRICGQDAVSCHLNMVTVRLSAGPTGSASARIRQDGRVPTPEVETLRARVEQVAGHLYALDTDPQLALLRDGSLRGASAEAAAHVAPLIDSLWQRYPELQAAVGDVPDSGPVPRAVEQLLREVEADLAKVTAVGDRFAAAWRSVLPQVDEATVTVAGLEAQAASLDVPDEDTVVAARRALDGLVASVGADPLAADATAATAAIRRAATRIGELVWARDGVGDGLAAARGTVSELRRLIPEGTAAREATVSRVADPSGLLEPLDPAVLEGDERALVPWLERLEGQTAAGDWLAASTGLERWRVVADGHLRNARSVVEANRAPLERRESLRGLLGAYEAKAAASGLAEHPELITLHRAARAALLARPCDLEAGQAALHAYMSAITRLAVSGPTTRRAVP